MSDTRIIQAANNFSNPNLLRNWYFVGGGTGRGVFPVNQRGSTSGTFNTGYFIDGWKANYNTNAPSYSLTASGMVVTTPAGGLARIAQILNNPEWFGGKKLTASVLSGDGTLCFGTITRENGVLQNITTNLRFLSNGIFEILGSLSTTFVAVKLELGTEQTLAHQENGAWVLNEIPDYEYELYRCMTSTADPTDIYANKSLATEQDLASIHATGTNNTTGARIPAGTYFYLNGSLVRAKENIGTGAPFTISNHAAVTDGGLNELLPKLKAKHVNIIPADVFGTNRALSTTSRPVGTASNLLGVSSSKIYSLSVNHIHLTPASMAFVGLYNENLYWGATQNCTLGDSTFIVDVIYYD